MTMIIKIIVIMNHDEDVGTFCNLPAFNAAVGDVGAAEAWDCHQLNIRMMMMMVVVVVVMVMRWLNHVLTSVFFRHWSHLAPMSWSPRTTAARGSSTRSSVPENMVCHCHHDSWSVKWSSSLSSWLLDNINNDHQQELVYWQQQISLWLRSTRCRCCWRGKAGRGRGPSTPPGWSWWWQQWQW